MPAYFTAGRSSSPSFLRLPCGTTSTFSLRFVFNRTNRGLCIVRCPHSIYKIRKEEIRAQELHVCRDAAKFPVVDALCAALFWVAEESCNFGCAAKAFDQLPVLVWGGVVRVHGVIKHHV